MKKKVIAGSLALLAVTAMYAQTYQLPNVGFENWEKAKGILWTEKKQKSRTARRGTSILAFFKYQICYRIGWLLPKTCPEKGKKRQWKNLC